MFIEELIFFFVKYIIATKNLDFSVITLKNISISQIIFITIVRYQKIIANITLLRLIYQTAMHLTF